VVGQPVLVCGVGVVLGAEPLSCTEMTPLNPLMLESTPLVHW
jgi:hypothetical protein